MTEFLQPFSLIGTVVVAVFALRGARRGAGREALGLAAVFPAIALAAPIARPALAALPNELPVWVLLGILALALATVVIAADRVLGYFAGSLARPSVASRVAGVAVGVLSGAVVATGLAYAASSTGSGTALAGLRDAIPNGGQAAGRDETQDSEGKAGISPRPVAYMVTRPAERFEIRTLPGTVRAAERAPIGFDVGGRVATVAVEIGEPFQTGETLATLDEATLRFTLEERRSALAEAEAELTEAEADHRRTSYLAERGVVAAAALDDARAALDTAKSRASAARARLARARRDLSDATLVAPYDGTVAARLVEPSERVSPGQPVLEIVGSRDGLELVVSVPETILARLERDATHEITAPAAPGEIFDGRVADVGARARDGSGFPVEIAIAGPENGLRPGMSAEVRLKLSDASGAGIAVPVSALLPREEDRAEIFVVDRNAMVARRRTVTFGDFRGESVLVSEGLHPGETIVTKGASFLADGQPVSLMGEGTARYNR
jgi:RND family efflux transporter MFP subunit